MMYGTRSLHGQGRKEGDMERLEHSHSFYHFRVGLHFAWMVSALPKMNTQ
jgi:hypothetical protein